MLTQWGPLDFHRQSLANLQKAMHKTRKLCAIMIDTIGRELLIDRESKLDANGWPIHQQVLSVKSGDKVNLHYVCLRGRFATCRTFQLLSDSGACDVCKSVQSLPDYQLQIFVTSPEGCGECALYKLHVSHVCPMHIACRVI